jgi:hypothetical protein
VKKDSRFVSFYSLQALIWHAAYAMIFFVGMSCVHFHVFYDRHAPAQCSDQAPPLAFFGVFGLVWLGEWADGS